MEIQMKKSLNFFLLEIFLTKAKFLMFLFTTVNNISILVERRSFLHLYPKTYNEENRDEKETFDIQFNIVCQCRTPDTVLFLVFAVY